MNRPILRLTAAAWLMSSTAALAQTPAASAANDPALQPKPASAATLAAQKAATATLPREDGRDTEFAARGHMGSLKDPIIRNAKGQPVWNLAAYDWVEGPPPPHGQSIPVA
jgi:alkyl sulfatase BDS1-like metallo-beta-lactamase superfamily hydrolase